MLMEGFPDSTGGHRKAKKAAAKAVAEAKAGEWKDFGENVLAKPLSPWQGETRPRSSSAEQVWGSVDLYWRNC